MQGVRIARREGTFHEDAHEHKYELRVCKSVDGLDIDVDLARNIARNIADGRVAAHDIDPAGSVVRTECCSCSCSTSSWYWITSSHPPREICTPSDFSQLKGLRPLSISILVSSSGS